MSISALYVEKALDIRQILGAQPLNERSKKKQETKREQVLTLPEKLLSNAKLSNVGEWAMYHQPLWSMAIERQKKQKWKEQKRRKEKLVAETDLKASKWKSDQSETTTKYVDNLLYLDTHK